MLKLTSLVFYFYLSFGLIALWAVSQAWISQSRTETIHPFKAFVHLLAFYLSSMLESGSTLVVFLFLCTGLAIMGMTYGPIGTVLSELFPTSVRYTGSALTFNLAGIFGASFAPLIATKLAENYGLAAVGYYLSAASILSLIAFMLIRETKNEDVNNQI